MKWGRLINAALDCGLNGEDALWAVLAAARVIEEQGFVLPGGLTDAEMRTLNAVARCGSQRKAAVELGLANSTVCGYMKRSARKLGVPARDAVGEAGRLGLLEAA